MAGLIPSWFNQTIKNIKSVPKNIWSLASGIGKVGAFGNQVMTGRSLVQPVKSLAPVNRNTTISAVGSQVPAGLAEANSPQGYTGLTPQQIQTNAQQQYAGYAANRASATPVVSTPTTQGTSVQGTLSEPTPVQEYQPTQADYKQGILDLIGQGITQPNALMQISGLSGADINGILSQPDVMDALKQNTTPISLSSVGTIDQSTLNSNVGASDIIQSLNNIGSNTLLNRLNQSYVNQANLLNPSQEENDLQTQLNEIRKQAADITNSAQMGIHGIEDKPIPMELITGKSQALRNQANDQLNVLASKEANLLADLGLKQSNRLASLKGAELMTQGIKDNIDLQLKIQDRLDAKEKAVLDRADKLQENAQSLLGTILDKFKGLTFDQLDSQGQLQLAQIATQAGLPLGTLIAGMDVVKNQTDFENIMKRETVNKPPSSYQEWILAGGQEGTGKSYADFISQSGMSDMPTSFKEWTLAGSPGTYQDWVRKSGLRPLPAATATILSEGFQIPLVTKQLDKLLTDNSDLFGPIKGRVNQANQYNSRAQTTDAAFRRASQVIGKYMEGGVLRKEDEEKYRRMLPQLSDKPDVARQKLADIKKLLADKSSQYLSDYESAGFDVSGFIGKLPGTEEMLNQGTVQDYVNKHPEQFDSVQQLINDNPNLDEQEILQILNETSFNSVGGDTNKAITSLNLGGRNIQVDQSIAQKLVQADQDFFKATGKHLQINQSLRTREQQAKLYSELSKKGARVAPPGKSFHEKGLAIDVTNWKEAEKYLRRYGFKNNLADDKGHFSVGEFS